MKERPILFSAPMVRALLDGSKSQTRRIVKLNEAGRIQLRSRQWHPNDAQAVIGCPYGAPGDVLWVRETHAIVGTTDPGYVLFRASGYQEECARHRFDKPYPAEADVRWRPSIHMPRWASRISLKITGVRVERLQDISLHDVRAEGCEVREFSLFGSDADGRRAIGARVYRALWESINGPGSWEENPLVWVVAFKRSATS